MFVGDKRPSCRLPLPKTTGFRFALPIVVCDLPEWRNEAPISRRQHDYDIARLRPADTSYDVYFDESVHIDRNIYIYIIPCACSLGIILESSPPRVYPGLFIPYGSVGVQCPRPFSVSLGRCGSSRAPVTYPANFYRFFFINRVQYTTVFTVFGRSYSCCRVLCCASVCG